jgi:hypothetical protein
MPAQIHCDQPVVIGQVGVQLPTPRERALRKAMDEQDGPSVCIARLNQMELNASATYDAMVFHSLALCMTPSSRGDAPANCHSGKSVVP